MSRLMVTPFKVAQALLEQADYWNAFFERENLERLALEWQKTPFENCAN